MSESYRVEMHVSAVPCGWHTIEHFDSLAEAIAKAKDASTGPVAYFRDNNAARIVKPDDEIIYFAIGGEGFFVQKDVRNDNE